MHCNVFILKGPLEAYSSSSWEMWDPALMNIDP